MSAVDREYVDPFEGVDRSDGGQAFPLSVTDGAQYEPGMSLRDYIAAKIVGALYTTCGDGFPSEQWMEEWARVSYKQADAMLRARKKDPRA
jgi:hypothetical protein